MIFDYLYFKINQAVLRSSLKDVSTYIVPVYMGGIFALNILVLSAFLAKINVAPFLFHSTIVSVIFVIAMMICLIAIYNKSKRNLVLQRFNNESKTHRERGNTIVILYVILSFLSIFFIAFFKAGKL